MEQKESGSTCSRMEKGAAWGGPVSSRSLFLLQGVGCSLCGGRQDGTERWLSEALSQLWTTEGLQVLGLRTGCPKMSHWHIDYCELKFLEHTAGGGKNAINTLILPLWETSRPPANDQLEADSRGLIGVKLEVSPPEVNWSKVELCTSRKKSISKPLLNVLCKLFKGTVPLTRKPGAQEFLHICSNGKTSPWYQKANAKRCGGLARQSLSILIKLKCNSSKIVFGNPGGKEKKNWVESNNSCFAIWTFRKAKASYWWLINLWQRR